MLSLFRRLPSMLLRRGVCRLAAAAAATVLLASGAPAPAQQAQVSYTQGTTINTASAASAAPTTVGVDGAGNVYFLITSTIYKATPNGSSYTVASTGVSAPSGSLVAQTVSST